VHEGTHDYRSGFGVIGSGRDVIIVSTGVMVHQALKVAAELSKLSINTSVVDLYRIKPVDTEALFAVLRHGHRIVTLEEHSIISGIGSLLSEALTERGSTLPLKQIALPDHNYHENGDRKWLHAQHGLDVDTVKKRVLEWGPWL
jgi:transketolase